jgi:GNAT superfamily N-acetyltransferase
MEFQIRPAKPQDFPAIYGLILALADFEKAPNEVDVTPEGLQADWNAGRFQVWVAEADGQIRGMALGFWRYSTWKGQTMYLEDILVTESMRGRGIGKMLIEKLIEEAKEKGFKRITWQVLDWNEPAINFYKKFDAKFDPEWTNVILDL